VEGKVEIAILKMNAKNPTSAALKRENEAEDGAQKDRGGGAAFQQRKHQL